MNTEAPTKRKFSDYLLIIAQKLSEQIYLKTLRDSFATTMPFMVLAGFVTLLVVVVLEPTGFMSNIIDPATLTTMQSWGQSITNGTLNVMTIMLIIAISYNLCKHRKYENVIAAILTSFSTFIVMTPLVTMFTPEGMDKAFEVTNVIPVTHTGSMGLFTGIIISLFATELFIKLSRVKKMQINLTGNIPPAVIQSFNVLIPIMTTVAIFATIAFALDQLFGMDMNELISTMISKPLSHLTTGLLGFLTITTVGNLFFAFGIHHSVITGALLDPFLIQNMQENTLAYANNQEIPHIITIAFRDTFGNMGGAGSTIALVIAIYVFGKRQDYKDITKLSTAPSIFNINEPIIFGLPVVFNPLLIIPFIIVPIFSLTTAYFATAVGLIDHVVVQVPWTVPPIISAFLATGGDWKAAVLQMMIIAVAVFIYLPFLKMDERLSAKANKGDKAA